MDWIGPWIGHALNGVLVLLGVVGYIRRQSRERDRQFKRLFFELGVIDEPGQPSRPPLHERVSRLEILVGDRKAMSRP